jgi:autotransporter-associated beta strand protein
MSLNTIKNLEKCCDFSCNTLSDNLKPVMPHSFPRLSLTRTLAIAALVALSLSQSAQAGETNWKNTSTTWSTAGNWTIVTGSAPPAPGDVAWFTVAEAFNPSLASTSPNIAGLYFSTTASSGYSFTRTSGAFTLTGSATSIGTETSNATAVAIGANNTSLINTIAVPITLAPASGTTSTFFQAAGGQLTLTSVTVISGTGISLNLTGGGIMSFAGANTYTGGTKIAGPTVINAGTGAIFGTGTLELSSGTYKNSTAASVRTLANVVSITGDFTFDAAGTSGINEFTGGASTTGDRTLTVNTATTRFVTNPFTLGGNLTTAGTSRLNITGGLNLGGADRTITAGSASSGTIGGAVDSSASGNTLTLAGNSLLLTGITAGATNTVNFNVNAPGGTVTFTASSTNTYNGSTTVTAGTLLVNGNNSAATGAVSVSGTLGGTGTIGGITTVNSGGIITGGTNGGIGTLSFNNVGVAIGGSGTYLVDIGGLFSDKLALGTGILDLSAPGDIISFNITAPLTGTSYQLATYASATSTFDTVTNLPTGYTLVYNPTELDLVITAVPEPSTWLAGALVFASLLVTQRKRFVRRLQRA